VYRASSIGGLSCFIIKYAKHKYVNIYIVVQYVYKGVYGKRQSDVRKMRFESKPLGVCVLGKDAIVAGRHAVQQVYNFRQFLLLEPQ
jgi:hypothetical protein